MSALELKPPRHCNKFSTPEQCHKYYTPSALCEWQISRHAQGAVGLGTCSNSDVCTKRKQEFMSQRTPRQPPAPPPLIFGAPPPPPGLACKWWCEQHTTSWAYKCASFPSCGSCEACSVPPPPPLPPRPPPIALADRLNTRFSAGVPSNNLGEAGVLLHIFDKTEDPKRSWLPCRSGWCASYGDRFSATMINAGQPGIWKGGVGIVLSPALARVRCSYGEECAAV